MHITSGRCIWLSRRCESTALLGKVFADTLDSMLLLLLLVDERTPVISPGSPTMSNLLHPEGPCVDTGQTTIKARSKFFYFTNIIVAGQKTTLLKVKLCTVKHACRHVLAKNIAALAHKLFDTIFPLLQLEKHIFDKFHDPRVYFAINSASWSSPRLPKVQSIAFGRCSWCSHCQMRDTIEQMPKFWLQDLFDANLLQSQLDEQASMFINRQVKMLPCPCDCMHAFSTVTTR